MFADDNDLFHTNKNTKVLFETVNKELHYVNEWWRFVTNKLSLNAGNIYLIYLSI